MCRWLICRLGKASVKVGNSASVLFLTLLFVKCLTDTTATTGAASSDATDLEAWFAEHPLGSGRVEDGEVVAQSRLASPPLQRQLALAQFRGYGLVPPAGSDVVGYQSETENLQDVRAGVSYIRVILNAGPVLGEDYRSIRLKLMLESAMGDEDCLPGSVHEAPHLVVSYSPSTAIDGRTLGEDPALSHRNSWRSPRFPYGGVFKTCYFTGAPDNVWRYVPALFTVKGADTNQQKFWCVASTHIQCRSLIRGNGVRESWLLTAVAHTEMCGMARTFSRFFAMNSSSGSADSVNDNQVWHTLGAKRNEQTGTYKVCYCPGVIGGSGHTDPCRHPFDFVQVVGLLYATRIITPQLVYPTLKFDLVLHCGDPNAGGCPLSNAMRFKLVDANVANDLPPYDETAGCRTAPQTVSYFEPTNCASATDCRLEPSVVSASTPSWKNLRLFVNLDNHGQRNVALDVCFCYEDCSAPGSWFKVDRIHTNVIQVLPNPIVASRLTDLQLYGPQGGWPLFGNKNTRETKLLFDPDGKLTSDDCYADPQDLRTIRGHYCYSLTDCKSPSFSNSDGHMWKDVRILNAGMYAVCYCDDHCAEREHWSFLAWHLVAGPFGKREWSFSKGHRFDIDVFGLGLNQTNRLRIIQGDYNCGEENAMPVDGVFVPAVDPAQKLDATGFGIVSLTYVYDGTLVTLRAPHGLNVEDYITIFNLSSVVCQSCADLVNSRPHRVIRLVSQSQLVIPLSYLERDFPSFSYPGAQWLQSNKITFQGLLASASADYKVCWGSNFPTSAVHFSASVGTLNIYNPPVFQASLHLTSIQDNAIAPIVINFRTRSDTKYVNAHGEMVFEIHFKDTDRIAPGVFFGASRSEVQRGDARQSLCGKIFKELWSSDRDGFPMPKGCFYYDDGATRREYNLVFSSRNGLKPGTTYQIVMDAQARATTARPPHDGTLQLWSMDDVDANPFGVVEFSGVWPDRAVVPKATASQPQFHIAEGLRIVASTATGSTDSAVYGGGTFGARELELTYDALEEIPLQLAAKAGAPIKTGTRMRVFMWPLTQWDVGKTCETQCWPHAEIIGSRVDPLECRAPVCEPEATVQSGLGSKRNILKVTFADMQDITDTVRHTVVLSKLPLPSGGFFATTLAAELLSSEDQFADYAVSTGALIFAKPSAVGSVVGHGGGGGERPFRGDQGNTLHVRITLGATVWGTVAGDAGFEITLPAGYICANAVPSGTDLPMFDGVSPQGRGEVGLDIEVDGTWFLSGQSCQYSLQQHGVVYAGSAILVKLTVNNPVFALPRSSQANVWTVRARGRAAPFVSGSTLDKLGRISMFVDIDEYLNSNVPVLGKLSGATLSPMLLAADQDRNWLHVFFTTEQSSHGTSPALVLRVPFGFSFYPHCVVSALPLYHYATLSSTRTGLTEPTAQPEIVQCRATKSRGSQLHDIAHMKLSRYQALEQRITYGFQIQVHNAWAFTPSQRDGFRLTTRTAEGDDLDGTYYTMRFHYGDGEGPGSSFGVYRLPMAAGTFAVGLGSMLPYSEVGFATRLVVFPLRVPFDSRTAVNWRIVAPFGYEWDFTDDSFKYQMRDILGATADLPISSIPRPPVLPPKNSLAFVENFLGAWNQMETYGIILHIRVPGATPRSSVNAFYVEFGYDAPTGSNRLAGAAYEAPQVRALINGFLGYRDSTIAGQRNRLLFQLETITNVLVGGGIVIEAPAGFVFEERCVVLNNPMREAPFQDLASAASTICSSEVPFTTRMPLVTITVVRGEVRAAHHEFMIDAQNPRTAQDAISMTWTISTYASIKLATVADLAATLEGFPIETPMRSGELMSKVSYASTFRDDHPLQESYVVLAFELNNPPVEEASKLTVKAPLGFKFITLCKVIVGLDVFGTGAQYPLGYSQFEPTATVSGCVGSRNLATFTVQSGLINLRKYVFRIGVFNPAVTPEHNTWTVSYAGECTVPFVGYRIWIFTEVTVSASHAARSKPAEETRNVVSIQLRPTNAITSAGFLDISAPFGFLIPTVCTVVVHRLDPSGASIDVVAHTTCQGQPQPTNKAEIHITDSDSRLVALELYRVDIEVVNPTSIPADPGDWRLESYSGKQAIYEFLLDVGEALSFEVTEVFHTFVVTYPPYVNPTDDSLELGFQIVLPQAVEVGDSIEIHGPAGYDFAAAAPTVQQRLTFRACNGFSRVMPASLPDPMCLANDIRFVFQAEGLPLQIPEKLSALINFRVNSVYPRRTLSPQDNVIHGEHKRGANLLSSRTVPAQQVTPRLQALSVTRMDSMIAVGSHCNLRLSFSPSQRADALEITTSGSTGAVLDVERKYGFLNTIILARVEGLPIDNMRTTKTNTTMVLEFELLESLSYAFDLSNVVNPTRPGRTLWSFLTYERPADATIGSPWLSPELRRDSVTGYVGPPTYTRIAVDEVRTSLFAPFFDQDGTQLTVAFSVYPDSVPAGQYLILTAPYGFEFVANTFKPGDGFPMVSGLVYIREPQGNRVFWTYVIQMSTRIKAEQLIRFEVRVNTPRTPDDLTVWDTDHSPTWGIMAASDADGVEPIASNDNLFPGFRLLASFGAVQIEPQPNGVTPKKRVSVHVTLRPQAAVESRLKDGVIHVRITAPLGFDFNSGCLAIEPNKVFSSCYGRGRIAILPVRGLRLPSGPSSVALGLTNAGSTPANNEWVIESFVNFDMASVEVAVDGATQRSGVEGYQIRELIQATVGANTQLGAVTTVFIWFLATHFVDVGGVVEVHAPPGFQLRCRPRVDFISLPPGTCQRFAGVTSDSGEAFHMYLKLTLTVASRVIYPNLAYEFGLPATNPVAPVSPNFWGLVLRNPRTEVLDATMTIDGYTLTDYGIIVHSLLASTLVPSVVNFARLTIAFEKELPAGLIGHVAVMAPATTKVLCQNFADMSAGGNIVAGLPLDSSQGTYGTHDCMLPNSITLHILPKKPISMGTYVLQIGVLNPGIRAVKDYWSIELLPGVAMPAGPETSPPTAQAILQIRVRGFGISQAFAGPTVLPVLDASGAVATKGIFTIRRQLAVLALVKIFVPSYG